LLYDIFWVFATPVMVTVAKGIDAPIKILASKTPFSSAPSDFAMLGLGDIVVPGLVIALCLRFDLAQYAKRHPKDDVSARSRFPKPYFLVALASYVVGLATTIAVMHVFQRAQPALLYLSPACTLGPLALALVRGEVQDLWTWSDAPVDKDKDKGRKLDETIEPSSEAAMKARHAVKEDRAEEVAQRVLEHAENEGAEGVATEDDSWIEGGSTPEGAKARRRKAGKKR